MTQYPFGSQYHDIEKMAEGFGATAEQLKAYFGEETLAEEVKKDKAGKLIVDSAVAVAPTAEEKAEEKPAAKKKTAKKAAPKTEDGEEKPKRTRKKAEPKAEEENKAE